MTDKEIYNILCDTCGIIGIIDRMTKDKVKKY